MKTDVALDVDPMYICSVSCDDRVESTSTAMDCPRLVVKAGHKYSHGLAPSRKGSKATKPEPGTLLNLLTSSLENGGYPDTKVQI